MRGGANHVPPSGSSAFRHPVLRQISTDFVDEGEPRLESSSTSTAAQGRSDDPQVVLPRECEEPFHIRRWSPGVRSPPPGAAGRGAPGGGADFGETPGAARMTAQGLQRIVGAHHGDRATRRCAATPRNLGRGVSRGDGEGTIPSRTALARYTRPGYGYGDEDLRRGDVYDRPWTRSVRVRVAAPAYF
jgi:hypothetical protein